MMALRAQQLLLATGANVSTVANNSSFSWHGSTLDHGQGDCQPQGQCERLSNRVSDEDKKRQLEYQRTFGSVPSSTVADAQGGPLTKNPQSQRKLFRG